MKKRTKSQNKQAKKILTVGELKTWLDGYCSAHDDNWTPTADQWNMIRDKIFSLDEGSNNVAPPAPVYAVPSAPNGPIPRQHSPSPSPPPQYSGAGAKLPPPPSSLSADGGSSSDASTSGNSGGVVGLSDRPATIMRDGKIITPNKETAGGPSDFA